MNVTSVNNSLQGTTSMKKAQDSYEANIQKQIIVLQERVKNIGNDKEKSIEQKMSEKQEIQKQIQSLNSELRQHQIQKRQEEAAKRQEAANRAVKENGTSNETENAGQGLSEEETGVLISLSTTKEQVAGMKKVRTDLQGKLRTAKTEEEKAELQEKIDNLTKDMSKKMKEAQDTISDAQKAEQEKASSTKSKGKEDIENEGEAEDSVQRDGEMNLSAKPNIDTDTQV